MTGRPFDLAKLDFDTIRFKKRKKLLLVSLPLCLVIGLFAIKMLSIPILSEIAYINYKRSDYTGAIAMIYPLNWLNYFESYKAPFNQGNAYFKNSNYSEAENKFRQALEMAPKERDCDVRINLALSIEQQADTFLAQKNYDQAILKYDEAKSVIYGGQDSCGVQFNDRLNTDKTNDADGDKQSDKKDDVKKIEKRISQKSDNAKQSRNNDQANTTDNKESNKEDLKSTEEKLKKLQENADKANKRRAERQQSNREYREYEKREYSNDYKKKGW